MLLDDPTNPRAVEVGDDHNDSGDTGVVGDEYTGYSGILVQQQSVVNHLV